CDLSSVFFSGRRRHTRFSRDWSSDVCSSDLFGPFVGGVLGDVSIRLPFFVTSALSLATLLIVWRMLPESLRPEKQARAEQRISRLQAFQADTTWLYVVAFLATLSLAALETAFPFLAFDRLGATTRSVGYIFAVMGLA